MIPKQKGKTYRFLNLLALAGLVVFPVGTAVGVTCPASPSDNQLNRTCDPSQTTVDPEVISDINAELAEKQKQIDALQQQADAYKKQISQTEGQVKSLQAELGGIDNQIALTELDIKTKETQIDSLNLEIRSLQLTIDQKTTDINGKKSVLADTIRELDASARTTTLTLVMQNGSLSDFYSQAQAQAQISTSLQDSIDTINAARKELQGKQDELVKINDQTKLAMAQLSVQKASALDQRDYKAEMLSKTRGSEQQYQQLLQEATDEADAVNSAISQLHTSLQEMLNGGTKNQADEPSPSGYSWPLASSNGTHLINAYFHDPTYQINGGIHQGIDMDSDQGDPVYAAADGQVLLYVPPVDCSTSKRNLSQLGIQHGGKIMTLYLHMSKFTVKQFDHVTRGTLIGYVGGNPGTAGSGTCTGGSHYSTGAHLHFQINANADLMNGLRGTPTKPLLYMPCCNLPNPNLPWTPNPVND